MSGDFHPVQMGALERNPWLPEAVTRRAYEVYCHIFSPQPAIVDLAGRGCRGGFGAGELVALLYARSFPKEEWSARFDEAIKLKPKTDVVRARAQTGERE